MANEIRVRASGVQGTITDNPLLVGATTMNGAGLAALPAIGATQFAAITLDPLGVNGAPEIVWVTAHTASATSATIVRGREGTTARQHATGTTWYHGPSINDYMLALTSGSRPSTGGLPYSSQMIYETDTACVQVNDVTNGWQQIGPLGAWTTYTPTWSVSAGSVAIGNGTLTGAYTRIGRTIHFWMLWVAGSTTTFGSGDYRFTLPVAPRNVANFPFIGAANLTDSGTTESFATWRSISAGSQTFDFVAHSGATPFRVGTTVPWTWANGDQIRASGTYEAAS